MKIMKLDVKQEQLEQLVQLLLQVWPQAQLQEVCLEIQLPQDFVLHRKQQLVLAVNDCDINLSCLGAYHPC